MSKVALLLGILAMLGSAGGHATELSPTTPEAGLVEALGLPQGELVREGRVYVVEGACPSRDREGAEESLVRDGRVYIVEGGVIYQVIQGKRFRPRCRDGELEALLPRVSLPGLFDLNASEARRVYRPLLDRLGHALVRGGLRDHLLYLVGHADNTGPEGYNLRLSQQRAAWVREYLVKRWGVAREQLMVEGRGESQPLASNETPEGRERNRRVEIQIMWIGDRAFPGPCEEEGDGV